MARRSAAFKRPPAPVPSASPAGVRRPPSRRRHRLPPPHRRASRRRLARPRRPAAVDLASPVDVDVAVDDVRRRGRGAQSNASGRYEPVARVAFDDGWQNLEDLPPFKTTVTVDATRKIITRNDSPDISFDRSINPYRGCEHGCIYCFARPTHAYLGLSPGLDFETKLFVKPEAAKLLERELSAPGYVPRTIAIGTNTDPYQPIEREYQVMRADSRSAGAVRPPGRHRHQVGAGDARHRHPVADGGAPARQGRAVGDDARPQAGARDGAARRDAGAAARCAAAA